MGTDCKSALSTQGLFFISERSGLIDNYNTGTLTPEKFATKAAMEIIPNVGENAFKALKTPGAAKVIESATIGADRALDTARNAKAGPYRN